MDYRVSFLGLKLSDDLFETVTWDTNIFSIVFGGSKKNDLVHFQW